MNPTAVGEAKSIARSDPVCRAYDDWAAGALTEFAHLHPTLAFLSSTTSWPTATLPSLS